MREAMFEAECSAISTKHTNENHVFVSGLARSGATILLNAIYESDELHHFYIKTCLLFLAPTFGQNYLSIKDVESFERAHGDSIKISLNPRSI